MLKLELTGTAESLRGLDINEIIATKHIPSMDSFLATWRQSAPVPQPSPISTAESEPTPPNAPVQQQMHQQEPQVANVEPRANPGPTPTNGPAPPVVETVVEDEQESEASSPDPDMQAEEEVYDPNTIVEDLVNDTDPIGSHARYCQEKADLLGTEVEVKESKRRIRLVWKVRGDVSKEESPEGDEFEVVGVRGFDFNNQTVTCGTRNSKRRINFLKLVKRMWPGDWRKQLLRLNLRI